MTGEKVMDIQSRQGKKQKQNKSPRAQRRSPGYDVQRFKKIFKQGHVAGAFMAGGP